MLLTISTVKISKEDRKPTYKDYRFAGFDNHTDFEGLDFDEKFNKAVEWLKEEIAEDNKAINLSVYEPIKIIDIFLS